MVFHFPLLQIPIYFLFFFKLQYLPYFLHSSQIWCQIFCFIFSRFAIAYKDEGNINILRMQQMREKTVLQFNRASYQNFYKEIKPSALKADSLFSMDFYLIRVSFYAISCIFLKKIIFSFSFFYFFIYFYQLEANFLTILQWFLPYIDMNQKSSSKQKPRTRQLHS